jgi:hypothetical protein
LGFTTSQLKGVMLRGLGQLALPNQFYMAWDEIVHVYSKAKLTVSSDKMIAIAGLADRMKDDLNANYLCGLGNTVVATATVVLDGAMRRNPASTTNSAIVILGFFERGGGIPRDVSYEKSTYYDLSSLVKASHYSTGDVLGSSAQGGELYLKGRLKPFSVMQNPTRLYVGHSPLKFSLDCEIVFDQTLDWKAIALSVSQLRLLGSSNFTLSLGYFWRNWEKSS